MRAKSRLEGATVAQPHRSEISVKIQVSVWRFKEQTIGSDQVRLPRVLRGFSPGSQRPQLLVKPPPCVGLSSAADGKAALGPGTRRTGAQRPQSLAFCHGTHLTTAVG